MASRLLALLGVLAAMVACSSTLNVPPLPTPSPPASCTPPSCVVLGAVGRNITLPSLQHAAIDIGIAGRGVVSIRDSKRPFATLVAALPVPVPPPHAIVYVQIMARGDAATLTDIPSFTLGFFDSVPRGTLRIAALEANVWTTVGKPGAVHGKVVFFPPVPAKPPIHLRNGASYELAIYRGGVIPPTPTPTPSPTPTPTPAPGALGVAVTCNASADACSNGSMTNAGSVQFTAIGDTATLTPGETPASAYTLKSDTCNTTDDPSAGGNWATFSPGVGKAGSSFTVRAKAGGTSGNRAKCSAVIADSSGQMVTIHIEVTLGSIGINGHRRKEKP